MPRAVRPLLGIEELLASVRDESAKRPVGEQPANVSSGVVSCQSAGDHAHDALKRRQLGGKRTFAVFAIVIADGPFADRRVRR